jgi:ubiquitin carboxyl-terminal hydrolase 14
MPQYTVTIKHAGKTHPLSLNTDLPPTEFKQAIYEATGVPVDRMKVMVKGGVLKDDHDWSKVAVKENQSFMVIGAAGPLPKAPEKPIVFLEDMDEADLANAVSTLFVDE